MVAKIGVAVIAIAACAVVIYAAMSRGDDSGSAGTADVAVVEQSSEQVAEDPLAEQWSSAPALSPRFVNINEPVAAPLPGGESESASEQ